MKFEELGLSAPVIKAVAELGFSEMTQIQEASMPRILQGKDVIAQAKTGSGKTAAFGLPIVEKVKKAGGLQAMILSPTRELALQSTGELKKFSKHKGLRVQAVYGGVGIEPQIRGLKDAEVVVGTPGRIIDHMERGTLDYDGIRIVVLDEADKMIDMGFIDDIADIVYNLPEDRQTLLFSATMPEQLIGMCGEFTRDPVRVKTETQVEASLLKQFYYDVDRTQKFSLLVHLLRSERPELTIVFCNSKRETDAVARNLERYGISTVALHGDLSQARRERAIGMFHAGEVKVLAATDVAARGLDIKNVTHVFNYDTPEDTEEYANRIGRTARAGEEGKAIALISERDREAFSRVLAAFSYDVRKLELPRFENVPFDRRGERGRGTYVGIDRYARAGPRGGGGRLGRGLGRGHGPVRGSGWRVSGRRGERSGGPSMGGGHRDTRRTRRTGRRY
ncbi:MAG: DEAD/DEAH box helicase [Candidatus Aenigmatarchaeota archaeon]